jgi:hypothetical protein
MTKFSVQVDRERERRGGEKWRREERRGGE